MSLSSVDINWPEYGIIAIVIVVIAILSYRLLRSEPLTRIVRLGVFIERARFDEVEHDEQPTREFEWPKPPE